MTQIAIIRIRGQLHIRHDILKTLETFKLHKKNNCVIIEETPITKGMINKAKDYITWGQIAKPIIDILNKKQPKLKVYSLAPPLKGYGRKGIKIPFSKGGALGDRGEKINDLLQRMIR